ncbi:antimicrobial peptide damicornin-like [Oculina patagonica]
MKSARMFFFLVIAAFLLAQVEKTSADSSFLLGTLNELDDTGDEITRRGCKNIGSDAFCRRMRKYCAFSNDNGKFMRAKCRYSCGCV